MDVICFLCVSLGSSTVQLHNSIGSRRACACSEAGFSSENTNVLDLYTTKEQSSVVRFFLGGGKRINIFSLHWEVFVA
jgi:hypothetical protein